MGDNNRSTAVLSGIHPQTGQKTHEIQDFGTIIKTSIGLDEATCQSSVKNLNQILADTMMLRDLYKKHHWQVSGLTFNQLHLMFDQHFLQQIELVDLLAERIQTLGGVSIAMAQDVAEATSIPPPPKGREEVASQLARLLRAHETILLETRSMSRQASQQGDEGTSD